MTVSDVCKRLPLPVYYDTLPEWRLAIYLWAQSYTARLDRVIGGYVRAPSIIMRAPRDMR